MKRISFCFIIALLFSLNSFSSQIPAWAKVLGRGGNDVFTSGVSFDDGSYLFGGYTTSRGDDESSYIARIDRSGSLMWEFVYDFGGDDRITSFYKLSDGSVYASGKLNYSGSDWGFITKFKSDGSILFTNRFSFATNAIAKSVKVDGLTPYVVGICGEDSFIAKGDSITSYSIVQDVQLYDFIIDASGFVAVGTKDGIPVVVRFDTSLKYKSSFYLVKEEGQTKGRLSSIVKTTSGNYVVAGEIDSSEKSSMFISKISSDDHVAWINILDAREGASSRGLQFTKGGELLLCGAFSPSSGDPVDGYASLWGVDGSIMWQRRYGGPMNDEIWSSCSASDGGYTLCGKTKSYGKAGENCFVIKTDEMGDVDVDCDFLKDANLNVTIDSGSKSSVVLTEGNLNLSMNSVKEIKKDPLDSVELICYNGPVIFEVQKLSDPFRLALSGGNFRNGCSVYIGDSPSPWQKVSYKSGNKVILKSGNSLKALFPKGTPVLIRLFNSDGKNCEITYTRE